MDKQDRVPAGRAARSTPPKALVLRLRATPEALVRLLRVPPLAFMQAAVETERLEIVHFDTARHLLRKSGLSLAIRRDGERCLQCLTGDDEDAPAVEDCEPVPAMEPRIDALQAAGGKLARLTADRLAAVFTLRLDRRAMTVPAVAGGGAERIAITIDDATIEAGKDSSALVALRLEAPEGAQAELYRLALALHRLEPLCVEPLSLRELGYRVAGGSPPVWAKAGTVALGGATSLDQGIAAVLEQCFEHWLVNQAAAADGRDIEGVHQMRVALRRLRAALVFLGPWLPHEQASWFEREVKWLARKLGAVRDLDVLLADTLAPVRSARGRDKDLKLLARTIEGAQAEAHRDLVAAMASARYTTLLLTLGQWIAGHAWLADAAHPWDRPLALAARTPLDGIYQTVLDAGDGFDDLAPEARHDLRLDIKRLRYALQFVGGAFGDRAGPWLRLLGTLQDGLGAANDAILAEAQLAAMIERRRRSSRDYRRLAHASGLVVGWWLARAGVREEELRRQWAEFALLRPFWRAERPRLEVLPGGTAS